MKKQVARNLRAENILFAIALVATQLIIDGCSNHSSTNSNEELQISSKQSVVQNETTKVWTLGGQTIGLRGRVVITDGSDTFTLDHNGSFVEPNRHGFDDKFTLAIAQQPEGQTCALLNNSGVVAYGDVSSVVVLCNDNSKPVVPDIVRVFPKVLSSNPAPNSSGIDTRINKIDVVFDRDMNPATISTTSVQLFDSNKQTIAGAVSFDAAKQTASFTPSTQLLANSEYQLTINVGAADTQGNKLETDYSARFITRSTTLRINNADVDESAKKVSLNVSLDEPSAPVRVSYATNDGSATAPSDYIAQSGELNFVAGETNKVITIPIVDDTTAELSESFQIILRNAVGAGIATAQSQITIRNDDAPTAPFVRAQSGDGQIILSWEAISGATSYNIYYAFQRGVSPNNYSQLSGGALVSSTNSSATISGLNNLSDYFFIVTAQAGDLSSVSSDQIAVRPRAGNVFRSIINDTGIATCSTIDTTGARCPQPSYPDQDGDYGRDAQARDGLLVKTGGGNAGFDFSKIGASGQTLNIEDLDWNCVRDNRTGLWWEVKTNDGGLRDAKWTYSWYSQLNNNGDAGTSNNGNCYDKANSGQCDTEKFVAEVNKQGLCGFNDWRLPTRFELNTIIDYSVGAPGPGIDQYYFPNTKSDRYWSSTSVASAGYYAWYGLFSGAGNGSYEYKDNALYVRLIRAGK